MGNAKQFIQYNEMRCKKRRQGREINEGKLSKKVMEKTGKTVRKKRRSEID